MDRRTARWYSIKALRCLGYEWLACDKDGTMLAYEDEPFKLTDDEWNFNEDGAKYLLLDNAHDIDFVKWEDEEPTNITEWIKKEEEDMKMYSIKDGKLECTEVDTTNGMVALGVDDVVVPDGATTIKVNARNWGKSFVMEKVKEIREALESKEAKEIAEEQIEMYKKLNNPDTVQIMADNTLVMEPLQVRFPFLSGVDMAAEGQDWDETDWITGGSDAKVQISTGKMTFSDVEDHRFNIPRTNFVGTVEDSNGQIHDIASMYPPRQLTLEDLDNVKIHEKVCEELNETYEKKNADYGNSFENSLDKHGMIAAIVRMDDKLSRLTSLNSKNEQQVMDESMRDTLMDLANYAIMSVMWLDEQ